MTDLCQTLCSGKDETLQLGRRNHSHAVVVTLLHGLEVAMCTQTITILVFGDLRDLGFCACSTVRINRPWITTGES